MTMVLALKHLATFCGERDIDLGHGVGTLDAGSLFGILLV
jgi:hypothetical protein